LHRPLNIAVFGSGRGSNFLAILTAMQKGKVPGVRIAVVISNNSASGILEVARANAIPAIHIGEKQFAEEEMFVQELLATMHKHDVNFIVLAGYMKHVPSAIVTEFRNRIINIHPALLPKFGGRGMYGMHVHEAVIAAKERFSGATVHIVDEEYDRGAIVLQKSVAVEEGETAATLAQKVLKIEHEIYPEAIKMIAEGSINLTWQR
jgi:phosphoribosylglycinamide formyltransferase 1